MYARDASSLQTNVIIYVAFSEKIKEEFKNGITNQTVSHDYAKRFYVSD